LVKFREAVVSSEPGPKGLGRTRGFRWFVDPHRGRPAHVWYVEGMGGRFT